MLRYVTLRLSRTFRVLEIMLAGIIILGVAVSSVSLIFQLWILITTSVPRSIADIPEIFDYALFKQFLSFVLIMIIGVELGEMMIKSEPSAIIDIMVLAIARKMLIYTDVAHELALGIVAIAALFAIRRYLLAGGSTPEEAP